MEKEAVIKLRDSLSNNGKNRSLRILFDNGINLTSSSDVLIWDDDNETITAFTCDSNAGSFIAGMPIKVISTTYDNIQFMQINTAIQDLSEMIDCVSKIKSISAEDKKNIANFYNHLYNDNYELKRKQYNPVDIIRDGNKDKD